MWRMHIRSVKNKMSVRAALLECKHARFEEPIAGNLHDGFCGAWRLGTSTSLYPTPRFVLLWLININDFLCPFQLFFIE